MIVEISGPKLGILDTLHDTGGRYKGAYGSLVRAEGTGEWSYLSEKMGFETELKTKRPTRRHMNRRRYVYGLAAYWTIKRLKEAASFLEYGMKTDLAADFDNFIHRRAISPSYLADFYEALRLRGGSTK